MQSTTTHRATLTNSAKRLRGALNRLLPLSKTQMAELTAELLAEIEPGERELFLSDFSVFAVATSFRPISQTMASRGRHGSFSAVAAQARRVPVRNGFVPWPSAIQRHA